MRSEQSVSVNLEECRPFIGDTISETEFTAIEGFNRRFIATNRELLDRRAAPGWCARGMATCAASTSA